MMVFCQNSAIFLLKKPLQKLEKGRNLFDENKGFILGILENVYWFGSGDA